MPEWLLLRRDARVSQLWLLQADALLHGARRRILAVLDCDETRAALVTQQQPPFLTAVLTRHTARCGAARVRDAQLAQTGRRTHFQRLPGRIKPTTALEQTTITAQVANTADARRAGRDAPSRHGVALFGLVTHLQRLPGGLLRVAALEYGTDATRVSHGAGRIHTVVQLGLAKFGARALLKRVPARAIGAATDEPWAGAAACSWLAAGIAAAETAPATTTTAPRALSPAPRKRRRRARVRCNWRGRGPHRRPSGSRLLALAGFYKRHSVPPAAGTGKCQHQQSPQPFASPDCFRHVCPRRLARGWERSHGRTTRQLLGTVSARASNSARVYLHAQAQPSSAAAHRRKAGDGEGRGGGAELDPDLVAAQPG
jgi:hypothetical protein